MAAAWELGRATRSPEPATGVVAGGQREGGLGGPPFGSQPGSPGASCVPRGSEEDTEQLRVVPGPVQAPLLPVFLELPESPPSLGATPQHRPCPLGIPQSPRLPCVSWPESLVAQPRLGD